MPLSAGAAAALELGGAAISAGGNMASTAIKNNKSYKYTKKLAEFQNDINLKNWSLQNAYNNPQAQMARLKAAGLNPNLVYQNGGATTAAGDVGNVSVGQFEYDDPLTAGMSQFQNMLQAFLNKDSVAAEIEKKSAETEGIRSDNIFKGEHAKYVSEETKYWLKNLEVNNEILEKQKQFLSAQTGLTNAQTQEAVLRWPLVFEEMRKIESEIQLNDANKKHLNALVIQIEKNNDLLTQQYQKALMENGLLSLQIAAEQGADQNTYQLMIRQLRSQVFDLEFRNSSIWRRHELNPAANVPESINIYREYRDKPRLEDVFYNEVVKGTDDWIQDAKEVRAHQKKYYSFKAIDERLKERWKKYDEAERRYYKYH